MSRLVEQCQPYFAMIWFCSDFSSEKGGFDMVKIEEAECVYTHQWN